MINQLISRTIIKLHDPTRSTNKDYKKHVPAQANGHAASDHGHVSDCEHPRADGETETCHGTGGHRHDTAAADRVTCQGRRMPFTRGFRKALDISARRTDAAGCGRLDQGCVRNDRGCVHIAQGYDRNGGRRSCLHGEQW